jgi:hypothetical protein
VSKIIYDVNQRFAVENGVPRLMSTNIQVIEGGDDLMSLAISLLTQLGFYDKFEENRTSQYIGYRLKNRVKGSKRYQLILAQRKEGLCISIPINFFESELLRLKGLTEFYDIEPVPITEYSLVSMLWVLPSKEDVFLSNLSPKYSEMFGGDSTGSFTFQYYDDDMESYFTMSPEDFDIETLADSSTYLLVQEDKLFPYAWQVSISSSEVLKEFLNHFAKIIMEAK